MRRSTEIVPLINHSKYKVYSSYLYHIHLICLIFILSVSYSSYLYHYATIHGFDWYVNLVCIIMLQYMVLTGMLILSVGVSDADVTR